MRTDGVQGGQLVSDLLRGAWRAGATAPAHVTPAQLDEAGPLLVAGGGAGLAWASIRGHDVLSSTPVAGHLRNEHDRNVVRRAVRERELAALVPSLAGHGIEFVLIKGWDLARRYPQRGMRSPGDIDLVVRPGEIAGARALARELTDSSADFVHRALDHPSGGAEALLGDHDCAVLGDVTVPVPRHEDALRLVCVHALQSDLALPRMLCDVGVLLESRPDGFDWDRCLTGDPTVAGWVRLVLRLAGTLVGAHLAGVPAAHDLPAWVVPHVLQS